MSESNLHPSRGRLLALLDGALRHPDAEELRVHLARCDACRDIHDDLLAVKELLSVDTGSAPLRPLWPAVRERMSPRPRLTPTFAFGAALAALAGVFLGLALDGPSPAVDTGGATVETLWTDVGTSLGADAGLYDLYFGAIEETTP